MGSAYGVAALTTSELNDFVTRAHKNGTLLEAYNWDMKAQSPKQARCTSALCRAKTLCTMKWWSTRQEYLACVDSVSPVMQSDDSSVPASVGASPSTSSSPSSTSSSQETLASADVLVAIGTTVLVTTIAVGCVVAIQLVLRARGVFTPADERAEQYENVFPML